MKKAKTVPAENGIGVYQGHEPFTEEEKAELRKKLKPGEEEPTTEGGWGLLGMRGMLKEAWEKNPVPLPDDKHWRAANWRGNSGQ